jgi:hypothetical protein
MAQTREVLKVLGTYGGGIRKTTSAEMQVDPDNDWQLQSYINESLNV